MVTLETDRLLLRMFREDDLDAYAEICTDPEVMRFIGGGVASCRGDAWRGMAGMLGHWQLRGYGIWAIEERASGDLIGRVGLMNPEGWPGIEATWMLRRASWGFGFATEGGRAVLKHAFTELQVPHIISLIDPKNVASVRLAERLGQQLEKNIDFRGHETGVYGIRRKQWEATQTAP